MADSDLTETFVAKVDAFAASLETEEQAMLIDLLTTDDVEGFRTKAAWPGLINLGIGIGQVASTAGPNPDGLVAHELTHVFQGRDNEPKG